MTCKTDKCSCALQYSCSPANPTRPSQRREQARFVKLCKETGLVGKGLTTTDCDLMFAKVCGWVEVSTAKRAY